MLRLHNVVKTSSCRSARFIWSAGATTVSRPCQILARRTVFTTTLRSSVERLEPNQHHGGTGFSQDELVASRRSIYTRVIILAFGVGLMAYGVYSVYELTTMWPKAIRGDLREGIKHRNLGDFALSVQYLKKAWEKAKSLPLDSFEPESLLKTSGIAITLACILEVDGKEEEAYNIYKEALWQLQTAYLDFLPDASQPEIGTETLKALTGPEMMRVAALAYKLGCMAHDLGKPADEEEKWLTLAVTAILKAVMEAPAGSGTENVVRVPSSTSGGELHKSGNMYEDLRLPLWSKMHDLAAPFESLGAFYSKQGNKAYALPLYLQAVSILVPPPPITTSPEDRCRGAEIMGRISGTILASNGTPEAIDQATAWAQKGLDVVAATRQSHPNKKYNDCEIAYVLLLLNVAVIRQSLGEEAEARDLYETGLKQSEAMGLKSMTRLAREALQDLDSKPHAKTKDKTD